MTLEAYKFYVKKVHGKKEWESESFMMARNKKSLRGLNGGFFWCPIAEDFRSSIIESMTQGIDFSFASVNTLEEISN